MSNLEARLSIVNPSFLRNCILAYAYCYSLIQDAIHLCIPFAPALPLAFPCVLAKKPHLFHMLDLITCLFMCNLAYVYVY
jgi:hypothetical protein